MLFSIASPPKSDASTGCITGFATSRKVPRDNRHRLQSKTYRHDDIGKVRHVTRAPRATTERYRVSIVLMRFLHEFHASTARNARMNGH